MDTLSVRAVVLVIGWSLTQVRLACPSTYHEFEGPEPIPYDTEGTPFPLSPRALTECANRNGQRQQIQGGHHAVSLVVLLITSVDRENGDCLR